MPAKQAMTRAGGVTSADRAENPCLIQGRRMPSGTYEAPPLGADGPQTAPSRGDARVHKILIRSPHVGSTAI